MEVSRGANLVGMSMLPLNVCPFSLLIKKRYVLYIIERQINKHKDKKTDR